MAAVVTILLVSFSFFSSILPLDLYDLDDLAILRNIIFNIRLSAFWLLCPISLIFIGVDTLFDRYVVPLGHSGKGNFPSPPCSLSPLFLHFLVLRGT